MRYLNRSWSRLSKKEQGIKVKTKYNNHIVRTFFTIFDIAIDIAMILFGCMFKVSTVAFKTNKDLGSK